MEAGGGPGDADRPRAAPFGPGPHQTASLVLPPLERAAGALSLVAGAIHGGVAPSHFAQWWGYGLFFLFATAAQVTFGLAIFTRAINPETTGPRWATYKRGFYHLGIWGNVVIIGLYVVTRTVGIPFFGPEAGQVESVAAVDVVSKIVEVALIVCLAVLLVRGPAELRAPRPQTPRREFP